MLGFCKSGHNLYISKLKTSNNFNILTKFVSEDDPNK